MKKQSKKQITTIKLNKETKSRLDRLKEHPRETYEQVLRKILFILNISKTNPEKATSLFRKLDLAIKRKENFNKEQNQ